MRVGQNELVQLWTQEGTDFATLKGTAAAIYYPDSCFRSMGDVSFIVNEADCKKHKRYYVITDIYLRLSMKIITDM